MDVEESAIASAFKALAAEEMEKIHPLGALAQAQSLPILPLVEDFQQTLAGILSSSSDDCVRLLTETGEQFQEQRERVRDIRTKLDDKAVARLREARRVVHDLGPKLAGHPLFAHVEEHLEKLKELLASEEVIDRLQAVSQHAKALGEAYCTAYAELFDARRSAYEKAVEEVRNRPEWPTVAEDAGETLLAPLQSRLGNDDDRQRVADGKSFGRSTLGEMESDNGARRALVPLENKRNFLEVSGDIMERVDPIFFSDPMTAAMKALGMN